MPPTKGETNETIRKKARQWALDFTQFLQEYRRVVDRIMDKPRAEITDTEMILLRTGEHLLPVIEFWIGALDKSFMIQERRERKNRSAENPGDATASS